MLPSPGAVGRLFRFPAPKGDAMSADTIVILLNGAITVGALLWAGGKGSAVLARLAGAVDKLADKVAGHEGRILVLEDRHYRPDRERDRPQ